MTGDTGDDSELVLDMRDVGMRFGEAWVLQHVDFGVRRGEVHALVGHNGAGKSTLMKIALGGQAPTEGNVRINRTELTYSRPAESRLLGLGMVLQERSLIRTLSGLDNIFLNAERTNRAGIIQRRAEEREAVSLCQRVGISRSVLRKTVSEMSPVQQQLVEIAKALRLARDVLILDEPTAPLTEGEIETLFSAVRSVAATGTGIVLITHHLAEVFEVGDRVTVLREGTVTLTDLCANTSLSPLIEAMLGKKLLEVEREIAREVDAETAAARGAPALEVRGLEVNPKLHDIDLSLDHGEILGIAGLVGSGRSTLLKTLFGDIRPTAGTVRLQGAPYDPKAPVDAIARSVYLIPEERARYGLITTATITDNVILSVMGRLTRGIFLRMKDGQRLTRRLMRVLDVRARGPQQTVGELSGGNQQKVVLSKALAAEAQVLLLDEPTFGVDVGAASDLLQHVRTSVDGGKAALWVSSDLLELLEVSDRIAVLVEGTVTQTFKRGDPGFSEPALISAMQRVRGDGRPGRLAPQGQVA